MRVQEDNMFGSRGCEHVHDTYLCERGIITLSDMFFQTLCLFFNSQNEFLPTLCFKNMIDALICTVN